MNLSHESYQFALYNHNEIEPDKAMSRILYTVVVMHFFIIEWEDNVTVAYIHGFFLQICLCDHNLMQLITTYSSSFILQQCCWCMCKFLWGYDSCHQRHIIREAVSTQAARLELPTSNNSRIQGWKTAINNALWWHVSTEKCLSSCTCRDMKKTNLDVSVLWLFLNTDWTDFGRTSHPIYLIYRL